MLSSLMECFVKIDQPLRKMTHMSSLQAGRGGGAGAIVPQCLRLSLPLTPIGSESSNAQRRARLFLACLECFVKRIGRP